jgi:hypothetical protein
VMQPPPPPGSAANPNAAPGYNIDGLLERFASTYRRLDNLTGAPKKRKERKEFDDIAKALCKSFADLADDQAFWSWLASIAQPDEQQVKVFLADLNGFESRQPRLFEGLGLDTLTSVQLTTGFTTSVEQYRGLIQGGQFNLGTGSAGSSRLRPPDPPGCLRKSDVEECQPGPVRPCSVWIPRGGLSRRRGRCRRPDRWQLSLSRSSSRACRWARLPRGSPMIASTMTETDDAAPRLLDRVGAGASLRM